MNQKIQNLKMFLSSFKVITKEEAINFGLSFRRNVYGDEVNYTEPKGIGAS